MQYIHIPQKSFRDLYPKELGSRHAKSQRSRDEGGSGTAGPGAVLDELALNRQQEAEEAGDPQHRERQQRRPNSHMHSLEPQPMW